jgi:hypothetical protein
LAHAVHCPMLPFMSYPLKTMILAVGLLLGTGIAHAADVAAPKGKPDVSAIAGSTDLQQLITQFKARRDAMLADRQALLDQLKTATADQRQAILEKMQAQQKDLIEAQHALGKQIRDEMRKLRESVSSPGHR